MQWIQRQNYKHLQRRKACLKAVGSPATTSEDKKALFIEIKAKIETIKTFTADYRKFSIESVEIADAKRSSKDYDKPH